MLTFNYQARNAKTGKKIKAQVQADNEQAAAKLIREQGLTPLSNVRLTWCSLLSQNARKRGRARALQNCFATNEAGR